VADSTAALQSAYNSLPASGGAIYLPAGTYTAAADALLVKKSNVHIIGDGPGVTIIKTKALPGANQTPPVCFGRYSDTAVRGTVENCSIRGITFNGNFANQYQGTGVNDGTCSGLRIEDVVGLNVIDCEAFQCDGYGFSFIGSNLPHRGNIQFIRCFAHDNAYDGFDTKAGGIGVLFEDCRSKDNGIIGTIPGRDSVGFDFRGQDVRAVRCRASGNISGNFRIRENAGWGARLEGCTSEGTPTNGYGYHIIGANTGQHTLVNCLSIGDYTAFRYKRGHAKLIGCQAINAAAYGLHIQTLSPTSMTTTTASLAVTTGVSATVTVAAVENLATGEFVVIANGANSAEGVITDINGQTLTLTIYVSSSTGAGPVASGATVSVSNIGSVYCDGCTFTRCGVDGVTIQTTVMAVTLIGCHVLNNLRYGINCVANDLTVIGGEVKNNLRGITFTTMNGKRLFVDKCIVSDDQTDKTQTHAFVWSGANNTTCTGRISDCDTAGNSTAVNSGTVPSGIIVENNTA
jgi:hypothetical protein